MKKSIRTLKRAFKGGLIKTVRMYYISIPLILFFALVITLSGFIGFGAGFSKHLSSVFQNRINMVVYFDRNTSDETVKQIVETVNQDAEIKKTKFQTKEEVLENFKKKHEGNQATLQALSEIGINPFGSSLVVFAKNVNSYEGISLKVKQISESLKTSNISPVEDINFEDNKQAINTFSDMLNKINTVLYLLIFVLSFVLFFTIYIALRFATQGDREEMKIMKLIGASNSLILGPTSVMGAVCGFFGALIALLVLYFIADYATAYTISFDGFNLLTWYVQNFKNYFTYTVSFGVIFGFLGSYLAVRRHI